MNLNEVDRLKFETQLWSEGYSRIIGLDEVGRGCLAGPVVASGVIFEQGVQIPGIRDSKVISKKDRKELSKEIKAKALFWTIKEGSVALIDEINILWASIKTMQLCTETSGAKPDYILVDGNRYTTSLIPYTCIVKGDNRSMSIGAASILAKVYRDNLMKNFHNEFPEFGWDHNVGYPTPKHKKALVEYGSTYLHRRSFKLGTEKEYSR